MILPAERTRVSGSDAAVCQAPRARESQQKHRASHQKQAL